MAAETLICLRCHASFVSSDSGASSSVICPTCANAPTDAVSPSGLQPQDTRSLQTSAEQATLTAPNHPPASFEMPFLAPPQAADELGRLGPYRVLGKLGAGGMGLVLLGEDILLQRRVALKVMLPQAATDSADIARFIREARAQAAVEHDHVASIHQVGEDRGIPFIAMPLLKGQTLAAAIKANPRVPLREAVRIGREVAEGLAAAHDRGLIHRDIKPANVWLEGENRKVKILDFGLARATGGTSSDGGSPAEALTQKGAVLGTPGYMSPEQTKSKTLDGRTDLFSLGVVLYEMLAGQRPFHGETPMELLVAAASEVPAAVAKLNPAVPPDLAALTMQLLAKNPDDRPANAKDTAAALKAIEPHLSITRPAGPPGAGNGQPDPWASVNSPTLHVPATPKRIVTPWAIAGMLVLSVIMMGFFFDIFIDIRPRGSTEPFGNANNEETHKQGFTEPATPKPAPTGKWLASVSDTGSAIELFDTGTRTHQTTLAGPGGQVTALAFSPDNTRLAAVFILNSGGEAPDHTRLRVWELAPIREVYTKSYPARETLVHELGFSPDGKFVVGGRGGTAKGICVWDSQTGKEVKNIATENSFMHLPAHGKYGASHNWVNARISIWNMETWEEVDRLQGPGTRVAGFDISPDGKRLACADTQAGVIVWDLDTRKEIKRLPATCNWFLVFLSDNKTILTRDAEPENSPRVTLTRWNTDTGESSGSFSLARSEGTRAFTDDRQDLFLLNAGSKPHVRVLDPFTGKERGATQEK